MASAYTMLRHVIEVKHIGQGASREQLDWGFVEGPVDSLTNQFTGTVVRRENTMMRWYVFCMFLTFMSIEILKFDSFKPKA